MMTIVYDYKHATELDNIAYKLYIKKVSGASLYFTQKGFIDSVDSEKFYKQAKISLRSKKIKKIKINVFKK